MDTSVNLIDAWMRSARPDETLRALRASGWLREHAPEIDRLYGIPQKAEHHPEIDVGIHIELVLEVAAQLSSDPAVRYAALVHDLGKALTSNWPSHFDHEGMGVAPGLAMGARLGVPEDWQQLGALATKYHLRSHRVLGESAKHLVRFFRDAGFFENPQLLEPFLLVCEADARGRAGLQNRPYPQAQILSAAFKAAAPVAPIGTESDYHSERIRRVAAILPSLSALTPTSEPCD
jgi:tRNA nucleotidyltransferase (CCA-adding enzyme)